MLQIGLQQEYVLRIGQLLISNALFTACIVSVLIIIVAIVVRRSLTDRAEKKRTAQKLAEFVLAPIWKFVRDVLENEKAATAVFPYIATFFIFIVVANFVEILPFFLGSLGISHGSEGLIPLFRSPSTDLNTTVALALISVGITQLFAIRHLGFMKYLAKFINLRSPLKAFIGLFEAVGEISKVLSFSFRLFGNMFAGSVLLIVVGFLVPYVIPLPFLFLELFVGLVQALIFSVLTLMFIKAALLH